MTVRDISLTAPIGPHELDRRMTFRMHDLVERVAAKAVIEGRGKDLLMRVYMAGMYHGAELSTPLQAAERKRG